MHNLDAPPPFRKGRVKKDIIEFLRIGAIILLMLGFFALILYCINSLTIGG